MLESAQRPVWLTNGKIYEMLVIWMLIKSDGVIAKKGHQERTGVNRLIQSEYKLWAATSPISAAITRLRKGGKVTCRQEHHATNQTTQVRWTAPLPQPEYSVEQLLGWLPEEHSRMRPRSGISGA